MRKTRGAARLPGATLALVMLALAITAGAAAADDSVPVSEPVTPKGASRPSSAPSPGSGQTGGSGQATGIAPSAPAGASA
ncbi:MAG: hypothetical protein WA005_10430, partial [Candidatus Binataceae bacterium]